MRVLLAHTAPTPGNERRYQEFADAAPPELDVRCFCVTIDPPGPCLSWQQLDRAWRYRDRKLMRLYHDLQTAAADCDIFLLYNGANIHPGLLAHLSTFNVYCCFDDPESSEALSKHVAPSFDGVFYGNIASRFQYEHWGCARIAHLPNFTALSEIPPSDDAETLLNAPRDIDIVFVGERVSGYRDRRLDRFLQEFPNTQCYGRGWPNGVLDNSELDCLYGRAKIGLNIHNSTGPINRRFFTLPAYGVMQLCDNKTGAGQLFELGKEIVAFDTIPEAIELARHYLNDDDTRLAIAKAAYARYWKSYSAKAIWEHILECLKGWNARAKATIRSRLRSGMANRTGAIIRSSCIDTVHKLRVAAGTALRTSRQLRQTRTKQTRATTDDRLYLGEQAPAYLENPESRGVNMCRERLATGKPFEWPNIVSLNWAVTSLIRDARRIVEIGSGTGAFAEFAAVDPKRQIDCYEEDDFARGKAISLRSRPNIRFTKSANGTLASSYDLLVSIEVIEHVGNLRDFLDFCSRLAPRAVFTTPNRVIHRGRDSVGPPDYPVHVREFTTGEFYWILKLFYRNVALYTQPDVYVPWLVPATISQEVTPLIAECECPAASRENCSRIPDEASRTHSPATSYDCPPRMITLRAPNGKTT